MEKKYPDSPAELWKENKPSETEEDCKECRGSGEIEYQPTSVPRMETLTCPNCKGTGKVPKRK